MSRVDARPDRKGLLRAALVSSAAAAVPVAGAFLLPPHLHNYEALAWLLLLVPAFLGAYHRAWRGVATVLAGAMILLAVTYVSAQALGRTPPPLLLPVAAIFGLTTLATGLLTDRLARVQFEAASERLALIDQLTGLPNRRHAELQLEMEFAAAERGRALSVVVFDIDNMQQFNARHGRNAGDTVLVGFASLLRQQKRRMDLAARYGPEEFVAILAGCMEEGAVIFAARVQEQLRAGRSAGALPTVSAGVAVYRPDMLNPGDLLVAAEDALRLAKQDGRDRVRIHGRGLDDMREPDSTAVQRAASEALELDGNGRAELRPFGGTARSPGAVGQGRSAFVLTADPEVRASLAQVLEREGFQVDEGSSVADAAAPLQQDVDIVFVELAAGAAAELVREIRFRSPTTRIVGITAPEADSVPADQLRTRVDGHYVRAADDATFRQQLRELLAERDALMNVQLRQRQQLAGSRSDERDSRGGAAADRYRALVQSSADALFTTDADGRVTFVNTAWTAASGQSVEESLGRPFFSFFHDDDAAALRADFDVMRGVTANNAPTSSVMPGASPLRRDARLITPEGGERWFEVRLQAASHTGGTDGAALSGSLTDVTDRKRAEDSARSREADLRSLLEVADDVMVLLNADLTVRYISAAVRRVLGSDPDSCLGVDPLERVHTDDRAGARSALGALLDEPGTSRTAALRLRRADGSWCRVRATGHSLLLTPDVEGIVVDVRELTGQDGTGGPAGAAVEHNGAPAGRDGS